MGQHLGTLDVLVIGGGPGGMAGAIAAAEGGASVAVIDELSQLGGNLPYSSGYVALACTGMQAERGITDSADLFVGDLEREQERRLERYGGVLARDVAKAYASGSAATAEWLEGLGVSFRRLIDRPAKHSVPRLHALEDPPTAAAALRRELERLEVPALTRLRVLAAERTESGAFVVRMTDDRTGEEVSATAERALIVATGGFQANFDMRREVQPRWLADTPYLGVPTALGRGHQIVAALGGRLVNMAFLPPFGHIATTLTEDAVAVNIDGRRFHDETDPHETPDHLAEQPERRAHFVFDEATRQAKREYITNLDRKIVSAESLAELARAIGVPPQALESTIEQVNRVVRGEADASGQVPRTNWPSRPIAEAPFHAMEVVVGVSVTFGGALTTPDGAVRDPYGGVVPGLYAVGNANGSLAPATEVGGVNLGAAFVLGRAAGRRAAALTHTEHKEAWR